MLILFLLACSPTDDALILVSHTPSVWEVDVDLHRSVTLTFNHPVDPASILEGVSWKGPGAVPVPFHLALDGPVASLHPAVALEPLAVHRVALDAGVHSQDGAPLPSPASFLFSTGPVLVTTEEVVETGWLGEDPLSRRFPSCYPDVVTADTGSFDGDFSSLESEICLTAVLHENGLTTGHVDVRLYDVENGAVRCLLSTRYTASDRAFLMDNQDRCHRSFEVFQTPAEALVNLPQPERNGGGWCERLHADVVEWPEPILCHQNEPENEDSVPRWLVPGWEEEYWMPRWNDIRHGPYGECKLPMPFLQAKHCGSRRQSGCAEELWQPE